MLRYRANRHWNDDEWTAADREMLRSYLPAATRWLVSAVGLVPRPVLSLLRDAYLGAIWEGSANVPKVPLGIYHAIVSRELAETVLGSIRAAAREHALPQWEWTARTVLMGEKFAFCSRPLSVINAKPYETPKQALVRADFPFHAGIGVTAGIAEIQFSAFAEMGALWTCSEENFIRAAMLDCMSETEPQAFNHKCKAYHRALTAWEGGAHARLFRPQFGGGRPLDRRRNAEEFYGVIRDFPGPAAIIRDIATP